MSTVPPIRFFCPQCRQTLKIGAPMAGRAVLCPSCKRRVVVPTVSDPEAEATYQRHRELRGNQRTPPPTQTGQTSVSSSPAAPEEIDDWLGGLWAELVDEDTPSGNLKGDSGTVPIKSTLPTPPPLDPAVTQTAASVLTNRTRVTIEEELGLNESPMRKRLRLLGVMIFLFGFASGFVTYHSWFVASKIELRTPTNETGVSPVIEGEIFYMRTTNEKTAEIDAVAILLNLDNPPAVQMNGKGLRADKDKLIQDEASDSQLMIEEHGGKYTRTDANGRFTIKVPKKGRYGLLLISANAIRPEIDRMPKFIETELLRFFFDPRDVVGPYQYSWDGYEFDADGKTYSVRRTF